MAATVATVAYLGLEARPVEVQVQLSAGLPAFVIVGLPDNAVRESRERVRAALAAIGLALPPKRITVNLSPADLPKEGSHYDLPIALCLLAAIGATDAETLSHYVAVGELCLDGRITASPGVLLAALHASSSDKGLICPAAQGSEASWAGELDVLAAPTCSRCWRISRARRCSRRRSRRRPSRPTAAPTSPRSRARKSPSARSRSPLPAATTC
jgi:magnesium chelatase family protein